MLNGPVLFLVQDFIFHHFLGMVLSLQVIEYFPCFWVWQCITKFEVKENKIWTRDEIKLQHKHQSRMLPNLKNMKLCWQSLFLRIQLHGEK